LKNKFFKVTSSLNNLSKPDYSYYHVNVNNKLQSKFIENLKHLFLVNDITWEKFSKLYNNLDEEKKKSYNFFIFDIIIYGNNSVKDLSLYKKNLTYLDFIKKSIPEEEKNNPKNLKKIY
jgi:superfamily II DNA/RNA helicase